MRGWVRFLHTMRLLLNDIFPSLKEQCIMPKGVKLLPMADFTLIFFNFCIFIEGNCWQYLSLMQLFVAPVSIKALHMEVPILVGNVVPCSVPIITSSV